MRLCPPPRDRKLVWWRDIDNGDPHVTNFYPFTSELLALRRRLPALQSAPAEILHAEDDTRVLAFRRADVVVVASFNNSTFPRYRLPFPASGEWREVFNSATPTTTTPQPATADARSPATIPMRKS
jgi:hypothetical protein